MSKCWSNITFHYWNIKGDKFSKISYNLPLYIWLGRQLCMIKTHTHGRPPLLQRWLQHQSLSPKHHPWQNTSIHTFFSVKPKTESTIHIKLMFNFISSKIFNIMTDSNIFPNKVQDTRNFFIYYQRSLLAPWTDNAVSIPKSSSASFSDLWNQIQVLDAFEATSANHIIAKLHHLSTLVPTPIPSSKAWLKWQTLVWTKCKVFFYPAGAFSLASFRASSLNV